MIFVCDYCNKEFEKAPAMVLRNNSKCCSVLCAKQLVKSKRSKIVCKNCKKEIFVKKSRSGQEFCSKKCILDYKALNPSNVPLYHNRNLFCIRCATYKDPEDFYNTQNTGKFTKRNGKFKYCKLCTQVIQLEQYMKRRSTIEGTIKENLIRCKSSSKVRNISFNIDYEYLMELYRKQEGKCAISGILMENATYYNPKAVSIDKIIPKEGYTKGNIQLVCWIVNQMKNDLSNAELLSWCSIITKNSEICQELK